MIYIDDGGIYILKNTFEIIDDITYKKPSYQLLPNDECNPMMIQRWISFIDPVYINFVNELYNMRHGGFDDSQQFYDFMKCVVPRKKVGKIKYISKTRKNETDANENVVTELAHNLEISKSDARDILKNENIMEMFKDDVKSFKKID